MAGLGTHKDIEKAVRIAKKQGWDVQITGGNHIRFRPPHSAETIVTSLTGKSRNVPFVLSKLRKAGLR